MLLVVTHFSSGVCLEQTTIPLESSEQEFLERWHDFQRDTRPFAPWSAEWKEEELKARFDQMHLERWSVYFTNPEECMKKDAVGHYKEIYKTPANWKIWGSRYPYPGAFSYNLATPSYNASLITIHGKRFLAMEAPTKENQKSFYELLSHYKVTDLVRLTPALYANKEGSFPYWEGNLNFHPKTGRPTIELDGREMRYFFTDCWRDHQGIEPERLLALVKAVMEGEGVDQTIAVHCRAGVGRTGTFLAAYALICDIDEQIARGVAIDRVQVSIDKVIWELSLQRPFMVTHLPQYIALYQLVNVYTKALQKEKI